MNLQTRIRNWLGINDLHERIYRVERAIDDLLKHTQTLNESVIVHTTGVARIIAKLDPIYGVNELDPQRQSESKKLEEEIIAKLYAEHAAVNKHTGKF